MKYILCVFTAAVVITAGTVITSESAYAIEGSIYGGPLGGTDIRSSYLPPTPGLYIGLLGLQSNRSQYYGHDFTPLAGVPAGGFDGTLGAAGLLYEYPTQIFGGTIASTISENYASGCLSVAGRTMCAQGIGDARADPIIYSRYMGLLGAVARPDSKLPYGMVMSTGINLTIPSGSYNPNNFYNTGKGSFVISPNVGFSYLTGILPFGEGTEITAKAFYNVGTYNIATQYTSGDVVDIDYAISERIGRWQAGVAGSFATQVNNDYKSGLQVPQNGHRLVSASTGPVIAYDFANGVTVKGKVTVPYDGQYGLGHGATGVVTVGFKAF